MCATDSEVGQGGRRAGSAQRRATTPLCTAIVSRSARDSFDSTRRDGPHRQSHGGPADESDPAFRGRVVHCANSIVLPGRACPPRKSRLLHGFNAIKFGILMCDEACCACDFFACAVRARFRAGIRCVQLGKLQRRTRSAALVARARHRSSLPFFPACGFGASKRSGR